MPTLVSPADRANLIRCASGFTTTASDPEAVIAHFQRLATWVEAAANSEDAMFRLLALSQQSAGERGDGNHSWDDPAGFVARACELYWEMIAPLERGRLDAELENGAE